MFTVIVKYDGDVRGTFGPFETRSQAECCVLGVAVKPNVYGAEIRKDEQLAK